MTPRSGLAAGLQSLSQSLSPQSFIGALNQMEAYNERKRRQDSFEESVKDLDFRASRDPALLKRVKKLQQIHPQAFSDSESFARFNAHLVQYEAGEELIDRMSAGGHLGTGVVADAWRKSLISNPGGTINDISNFLKGQEAAAMSAARSQELQDRMKEESDIRAFGLSEKVMAQRSALGNPNSLPDLQAAIAADPSIPVGDKADAMDIAVKLIGSDISARRGAAAASSQESALELQPTSDDAEAANTFVQSLDPNLTMTDKLKAVQVLPNQAQRQFATDMVAQLEQANRQQEADELAAFKAQAQAQKQQRDFIDSERKRFEELGIKDENVNAIIDSLRKRTGVDVTSVEDLQEIDDEDLKEASSGTGMSPGEFRRFLIFRDLADKREGAVSAERRLQSTSSLLEDASINRTEDTGVTVGRGSQRRKKYREIVVGSNQFRNAYVLANSKIQQATMDGDLDGLRVQTRLLVPTESGYYTAVQGMDGSVTGFGVKPNGDVQIVDMVEQDGSLSPGPEVPKAEFLLRVQKSLPEDRPMTLVRESYKNFESFLSNQKELSPRAKKILEDVKARRDLLSIDPDSDELNLMSATANMAHFIKLRQRYDAELTNAKLEE